jgi:hypothetical protein
VNVWLWFNDLERDTLQINNVQTIRLVSPGVVSLQCFGNDEVYHRDVARVHAAPFTFAQLAEDSNESAIAHLD